MPSTYFNIVSGLVAIFAGFYLASVRSVGSDSMMQIIANGMGWYFVARGVYMISSAAHLAGIMEEKEEELGENNKRCEACMSFINKRASKCKHCGSDVAHD